MAATSGLRTFPSSWARPKGLVIAAAILVLTACSGSGAPATSSPSDQVSTAAGSAPASNPASSDQFPDVIKAEARASGDQTYDIDVTMTSPYDTPERYADGWRIIGPDGTVYGEKTLTHDHASEQPFTRSQTGVSIPDGVGTVEVEGRDLKNGYGGKTVEVTLPAG